MRFSSRYEGVAGLLDSLGAVGDCRLSTDAVNHHENALSCRFAVNDVALEGDTVGQLGELTGSILAMAFVIPALQPRREVVDSDAHDYQHQAFYDHHELVHSRSISRDIAACSR